MPAHWRSPALFSERLMPQTPAYHEIWLDGERIAGGEDEVVEPIYGKTYLPRKFKTVVAVPPSNDVDIFANDLGFIAIIDAAGEIAGYNVTVGGGMGMTHGEPATYPRTADVLGFCETKDAVAIAEAVVTVQRDWGDRNRPQARAPQYTIEDRGLEAFRAEVERRAKVKLAPAGEFQFTSSGDRYGWSEGAAGKAHLTIFVAERTAHRPRGGAQLSALRRIAQIHDGELRITPNQNLIVANVPTEQHGQIETIARDAGLLAPWSGLRRNSMACVALPTCGLALAESERYMPELLAALDGRLAAHGLSADDITIRMTGCPNGCARPYLAEIGVVGKDPAATTSISAAPSTVRGSTSSMAKISTTPGSLPRSTRCSRPSRAKGSRESGLVLSPSAPVLSPRRPTAAIFMPMQGRSARHERRSQEC